MYLYVLSDSCMLCEPNEFISVKFCVFKYESINSSKNIFKVGKQIRVAMLHEVNL